MATRTCTININDDIKQKFSADYGVGLVPLNNAVGYLCMWASGSDSYAKCIISTESETSSRAFSVTGHYLNEADETTFFIAAVWDKHTNCFSFHS